MQAGQEVAHVYSLAHGETSQCRHKPVHTAALLQNCCRSCTDVHFTRPLPVTLCWQHGNSCARRNQLVHRHAVASQDSPTVSAATVLDAGTADVAAPAVPLNSTAHALGQQVTGSTYPQELPALPQQGFQQLLPSPSMMPHSQQHPSSLQATQHDALPQPSVTASLQSGTLSDQPPLVVFARKVARPVLPANIPAVRLTHGLAGTSRSSLEDLPASLRRLRIPGKAGPGCQSSCRMRQPPCLFMGSVVQYYALLHCRMSPGVQCPIKRQTTAGCWMMGQTHHEYVESLLPPVLTPCVHGRGGQWHRDSKRTTHSQPGRCRRAGCAIADAAVQPFCGVCL